MRNELVETASTQETQEDQARRHLSTMKRIGVGLIALAPRLTTETVI
jgi:hypothetical protein